MTQPPPPGWYPDPQDPAHLRWWDGRAWTAQTGPGAQASAYGQPPTVGSTTPYVRNLTPGGARPVTMRGRWGRSADRTALAAMGIAVVYTALAVFAHFWLIGILPIILSLRAIRMGSRLGALAMVVSIAAAVGGFVIIQHYDGGLGYH